MRWTDASRIELYQSCPRRYYHKYVLRLVPKEQAPSTSAMFGVGLHGALASIYVGDFAEYVPCVHNEPPSQEDGFCIYCRSAGGQIRKMFNEFLKEFPKELEHKVYTQHLGLLLTAKYLERWQRDPLRDGTVGVEVTFSVDLGGIPYVGRLDLLATWDKIMYVTDHKTKSRITDNFIRGFKLDAKMSSYMWAVSELMQEPVHKGMINTVLVANNITRDSFSRFETSRTMSDIAQWEDNALRILDDISHDSARDFFPMNSQACFSYNRECEYYRICTATAHPENAIAAFYDVRPESDLPSGLGREIDE